LAACVGIKVLLRGSYWMRRRMRRASAKVGFSWHCENEHIISIHVATRHACHDDHPALLPKPCRSATAERQRCGRPMPPPVAHNRIRETHLDGRLRGSRCPGYAPACGEAPVDLAQTVTAAMTCCRGRWYVDRNRQRVPRWRSLSRRRRAQERNPSPAPATAMPNETHSSPARHAADASANVRRAVPRCPFPWRLRAAPPSTAARSPPRTVGPGYGRSVVRTGCAPPSPATLASPAADSCEPATGHHTEDAQEALTYDVPFTDNPAIAPGSRIVSLPGAKGGEPARRSAHSADTDRCRRLRL